MLPQVERRHGLQPIARLEVRSARLELPFQASRRRRRRVRIQCRSSGAEQCVPPPGAAIAFLREKGLFQDDESDEEEGDNAAADFEW